MAGPPRRCSPAPRARLVLLALSSIAAAAARLVDLERDAGAIPGDASDSVAAANAARLTAALAGLGPGDELVVPNRTFYLVGGIVSRGLHDATLRIDGTLEFSRSIHIWPRQADGHVAHCLTLEDPLNVTITSSERGTIEGNGGAWWGVPGIGYLEHAENRPKLLRVLGARQCLFENLLLKDSPDWTLDLHGDALEIRRVDVSARRTGEDGHGLVDLSAFNTDGIDIHGSNVWVHDCNIWNQDDCVAVKDGSQNVLVERVNASGMGLTIGSIAGSHVRNITFRQCRMHRTAKGIYIKARQGTAPGTIEDVLYEDIVMEEPLQAAIWIGPAQQVDSRAFWEGHPCSLFWPEVPFATCTVPSAVTFRNITLRNITIRRPRQSPGLVFGNASNPMAGIVFDGVRVTDPGSRPWGGAYYKCEHVQGTATGGTWPVPPCFTQTDTVVMV